MNVQRVFCMECGKDLSHINDLHECECGCKDFVYGDTVIKTENGFACNCGSIRMDLVSHFNMTPRFVSTYKCCKCGAIISKEIYNDDYYFGW